MNVAYCDWRTPRCSSSGEPVKPSNRRLPPPRTTGATMIVSSSTRPASSAWRMTSAPPITWTSLSPAAAIARSMAGRTPETNVKAPPLGLLLGTVGDDEDRQVPGVLVAPVPSRFVGEASADDRAHGRDHLREPGGILTARLAPRVLVVGPRAAEDPVVQALAALAEPFPRPI